MLQNYLPQINWGLLIKKLGSHTELLKGIAYVFLGFVVLGVLFFVLWVIPEMVMIGWNNFFVLFGAPHFSWSNAAALCGWLLFLWFLVLSTGGLLKEVKE